jgi:MHS family shikimate/dehydroshikimate transporter-like MFS transporter
MKSQNVIDTAVDTDTDMDGNSLNSRVQRRRAIVGSSVGTLMEWYDFTLYGLAAALVFGQLYFPGAGDLAGTLGAFAAFAVGFVARPFGGLVFAHFGDRLGRRNTLLATLVLMGAATTMIGLLPTAETIGIWAPICLVVLRIFQGAGAGAETAGAMTMVAESTPARHRAFAAGFPTGAAYAGMALATAAFALVSALPEEQFLTWGWRIPFVASIIIVAIAMYFRFRVKETVAFEAIEGDLVDAPAPIKEAVLSYWRVILPGMALFAFSLPWVYLILTFALNYTTGTLSVDRTHVLIALIAAELLTVPAILGFGRLADKIGRKPLLIGGAIFGIVYAFPMFFLFLTENSLIVGVAMVLGLAITQGATVGVSAAMLSEIFPTRMRWTGIAISREIPAALVAGTAPLVATALVAAVGGAPWPVATFLCALSAVGLIGALCLPETLNRENHRAKP